MSTTSILVLTTVAIFATNIAAKSAMQRSAPPTSNQLKVVAVVGCVAREGDSWMLTSATAPIVVRTSDGRAQTGSGVTADKARATPMGKERYRLMNMLDEFGVAQHKGQKVLVKGLLLGDTKDRR